MISHLETNGIGHVPRTPRSTKGVTHSDEPLICWPPGWCLQGLASRDCRPASSVLRRSVDPELQVRGRRDRPDNKPAANAERRRHAHAILASRLALVAGRGTDRSIIREGLLFSRSRPWPLRHVGTRLTITVHLALALALHSTIGARGRTRFASRSRRSRLPLSASTKSGWARSMPHERFVEEGSTRHRHAAGTQGSHRRLAGGGSASRAPAPRRRTRSSHLLDVQGDHQRRGDELARGGGIKLDDPVAKYLPALKAVKVFKVWNRNGSVSGAARTADHHQAPCSRTPPASLTGSARTSTRSTTARRSSMPIDGRVRGAGGEAAAGSRARHPFQLRHQHDILGALGREGLRQEVRGRRRGANLSVPRHAGLPLRVPPDKVSRLAIVYAHAKPPPAQSTKERAAPSSRAVRGVEPMASSYAKSRASRPADPACSPQSGTTPASRRCC